MGPAFIDDAQVVASSVMSVSNPSSLARLAFTFLVILTLAPLVSTSADAAGSTDWWGFHRDARHTGAAEGADLPLDLGLLWAVDLDGAVKASPLVADGMTFAATDAGNVYAFDRLTGAAVWGPIKLPNGVTGTPAYEKDRLYVATTNPSGTAGELVVLDARNGHTLTTMPLAAGSYAGPTVKGGTLFVGDDSGSVHAYETEGMGRLWTAGTAVTVSQPQGWNGTEDCCLSGNVPAKPVRAAPAVHKDLVYFGSFNQLFFAVDASGTPGADTTPRVWIENLHGIQYSSPAVSESRERVYVGSYDGMLYALHTDPLEGPSSKCLQNSARTEHPYPHACSAQLAWRYDTDSNIFSSPAVTHDTVYVGDNDGRVHAVNAQYAGTRWTFQTGASVKSSPAVVNHTITVGSDDGHLYVFKEDLRRQLADWGRLDLGGAVHASPAIAGGIVYAGTMEGRLVAVTSADQASATPIPTPRPDPTPSQPSPSPNEDDVALVLQRIVLRPDRPDAGNETEIAVVVRNQGGAAVTGVSVRLYAGDELVGDQNVDLPAGEETEVVFTQTFEDEGLLSLRAVLDEARVHTDDDPADNEQDRAVGVGPRFTGQGSDAAESPIPGLMALLVFAAGLLALARRR